MGGGILLYLSGLCLTVVVVGDAFPEFTVLSHWVSPNLTMLFYFMAGWLISEAIKTSFRGMNYKRLFTVLLAVFYVISVVASYFGVMVPGMTIWLSLSLFGVLLTREGTERMPAGANACVQAVSRYSYGVYLSHFMLISAIVATGIHTAVPLWIEPIVMAATVLIAMTITMWLLDKMKIGKFVF